MTSSAPVIVPARVSAYAYAIADAYADAYANAIANANADVPKRSPEMILTLSRELRMALKWLRSLGRHQEAARAKRRRCETCTLCCQVRGVLDLSR